MLTLGIAIIGLCLIWLAPRPVQEIWTAEELDSGLGARVTAAHVKEMPALAVIDLEGDGDDDLVYYNRQMERLLYYRNRGSEGLVLTGPSRRVSSRRTSCASPNRPTIWTPWPGTREAEPGAFV